MAMNKLREELAQAFISSLNEGEIPWEATWKTSRPENAVTGKAYRGVNSLWLSMLSACKGYTDPRWCTFNQAKESGWSVRKGEKSAHIEFWSLYDKKTKKTVSRADAVRIVDADPDRKDDIILMSRTYCVFNAAQIDGIPEPEVVPRTDIGELRAKRDLLLKNMCLGFREEGDRAYYTPSMDRVTLPPEESFYDVYGYMATFLHECGHATGHETRLNRDLSGAFGSEKYAKEELRAEIASAFTAQALGLTDGHAGRAGDIDNHKAYIQSWAQTIKSDPNELFAAIRDAEKISDYLLEKGEFFIELGPIEPTVSTKPSLDSQIHAATGRRGRKSNNHNQEREGR